MAGVFQAVRVSKHVYWVGAIDWALRDFHGYSTARGTSYNAYLVVADKIALIDTVRAPFRDEMIARIRSVVDPERIDVIVSNHAEMDHSACLPHMVELARPERVLASAKGVDALRQHLRLDGDIEAVKDGDRVSLGEAELEFAMTPMVHWPESMVTYLPTDRVLFSQDGFGMHLASGQRFADELDKDLVWHETTKYFANILMPFSRQIVKLLERVGQLQPTPEIVATDHGPIWRKDLQAVIDRYAEWAEQRPTTKAVVVYDTMWGSTAKIAGAIAEGLIDGGASAKVMPLSGSNRSDVATEVLEAGALLVGSPTINSNIFPTVADVMTYLKGLKPQNLIGAAFGSYGWGGEAVKHIDELLGAMKVERVADPVRCKYVPDEDALSACRSLGSAVAARLRQSCEASSVVSHTTGQ